MQLLFLNQKDIQFQNQTDMTVRQFIMQLISLLLAFIALGGTTVVLCLIWDLVFSISLWFLFLTIPATPVLWFVIHEIWHNGVYNIFNHY